MAYIIPHPYSVRAAPGPRLENSRVVNVDGRLAAEVRLPALQGEQLPFGLTNHPNVVATHYHFYVQVGCAAAV